jgi:hypothetical protein
MACRLDLPRQGNKSRGGRRYPLRDPALIPPVCWIRARVVPHMRDQLERWDAVGA